MFTTRPAAPPDAPALGAVHVRAWQAAYRGLMPDDYLDALSPDERAADWSRALERPARPRTARLVAEDDQGRLAGFIVVGPTSRAGADDSVGEVFALNVDPDVWGRGAGQTLLADGVEHLRAHGFSEANLWVLPGNTRARRFYEPAGWLPDGASQTTDVFGVTVDEIGYHLRLVPPA